MWRSKSALLLKGALFFVGMLLGCDLDHGLQPQLTGIGGTAYFGDLWPEDSLQQVRVVVFDEFPPSDFTSFSGYSNLLPVGGDSAEYFVALLPGEYHLISLVWGGQADTIEWGRYLSPTDSAPGIIKLREGEQVTGVDVYQVGIAGTVDFPDPWPINTGEVRVIAYESYPPPSLLDIKGFSSSLDIGSDREEYFIMVPPGTYEWVVVVWRGAGDSWIHAKDVGHYHVPPDTTPAQVVVEYGNVTKGIDITVDFYGSRLHAARH